MKKPVFALIDCNNFFVSCERIFRPDLEDKPVVVLSSNDGCVVARSNEVKALGIAMAGPAFKYKQIFKDHGVVQFSANFELYGDISRRITDLLSTITPRIEVYSVDESFLDLSELRIQDYAAWGRIVRETIMRWVGVPVSIGIGPTKTLAKLASDYAKQYPETSGVLHVRGQSSHVLSQIPIGDVWGVGWRLAPKLRAEGITNTEELSRLRPPHAQQLMGIHGRQLVAELNGISCYPLETAGKRRQSIARTRTFGEDTNDRGSIEAAITTFATQAAFRLRASRQVTRRAALFLATNKHKPDYQRWTHERSYHVPTADTGQLITSLLQELNKIYNPARYYYRAGVFLWDFLPEKNLQTDLLGMVDIEREVRAESRMVALDTLNEKFGKETIRYAAQDLGNHWQPRYNLRSPRYTSRWEELPSVRIL